MKLCWKTHKTLEEFCKTVCTGKIGWNRQRRKDCRNNTMCQECKRRFDAPMHTANAPQQGRRSRTLPAVVGSLDREDRT
jgi:hypothetical protein